LSAVGFAARIVLATTLFVASVAKLRAPTRTREQMTALLGATSGTAVAVVLPLVELVIAVLLVAWWSVVPGVVAVVMLLAFTGVLVRAQTRRLPCPCFGGAVSRPVGPSAILRNAWLVALGVLATASPADANVVATLGAVVVLGAVTGAVTGTVVSRG
jgi:hypothetical protein